ncbi:FG-GAP repeat domain-containing protein [Undibacterium sp. SXout11W]|uniref:FG-GAP repeat domain-containing protein n=1 Tax=Undibacterium sp. SXout11W TaxID=3413050 RepID=UPI003BF47E47
MTCTGAGGSSNQSVALIVPIPVQKTSYLNAKNLNIPAQDIPKLLGSNGFAEYFTGGVAFGDFFQDGNISMVGFSNRNPMSTSVNNGPEQGNVYFYTKVNGVWVDKTKDLLADTAGCISPRKVLVADFNGDGVPDVFASCHGSEFGPSAAWTGEHPRVLLSQTNGTYKNVKLDLNCYCHGASAGDVNGDGTIDVVTSDGLAASAGKSTMMLLSNDGQGNFTTKHLNVAKDADVAVVDSVSYYYSYFNVELIDFNNDGKLDLYLSGSEMYENSYILLGDQIGSFNSILKKFDRTSNDVHVTDTVFVGGVMYVHLYVNGTKTVQVRKYAKDFSSYEVIYSYDGDDFVYLMPYGNSLVSYDSAYKISIKQ